MSFSNSLLRSQFFKCSRLKMTEIRKDVYLWHIRFKQKIFTFINTWQALSGAYSLRAIPHSAQREQYASGLHPNM